MTCYFILAMATALALATAAWAAYGLGKMFDLVWLF